MAAVLAATALAQDEHQRRLGAELVVMAGDARRLAAGSEPARQLAGVRARLAGAFSSLPLLLRQAGGGGAERVPGLRAAFTRGDWKALDKGLGELRRRHPLDLGRILPATPTAERLRLGESIHRQACAGCHDTPAADDRGKSRPDVFLPAFNLAGQMRTMPQEEFAARLLNGVRGNASTAYHNPFSDLEIRALIVYYAGGAS